MNYILAIKTGLFSLLMITAAQAQVNVYLGQKDLTYPQKGGIYETAEDLLNDKIKD
jgi:hypothetical protein